MARITGPDTGLERHGFSPSDWLLREGRFVADAGTLLGELCRRLAAAGLPLWRVTYHQQTLHPQIGGTTYRWLRDRWAASVTHHPRGCHDAAGYLNSPLAAIAAGAQAVRRRLDGADARLDFPVLKRLKGEGATDYSAMPVTFSDGLVNVVTWATDRPGGFTDDELRRLEDLLPALAAVLETRAVRRVAATLLDTYVGHTAGERILRGEIGRGTGVTIHAPLWCCDLRNFTALSETLSRQELLTLLDQYFEAMVASVSACGGEVLKFVGDGMLAVFPPAEGQSLQSACRSALTAAEDAFAAMAELNRKRAAQGKPALGLGLALHVGDVIYGNVGAPERLDFTVIGPAVNLAYRLEALCETLGCTPLISRDFAHCCGRPLQFLGQHRLRGIAEPHEIFTLPQAVENRSPPLLNGAGLTGKGNGKTSRHRLY